MNRLIDLLNWNCFAKSLNVDLTFDGNVCWVNDVDCADGKTMDLVLNKIDSNVVSIPMMIMNLIVKVIFRILFLQMMLELMLKLRKDLYFHWNNESNWNNIYQPLGKERHFISTFSYGGVADKLNLKSVGSSSFFVEYPVNDVLLALLRVMKSSVLLRR